MRGVGLKNEVKMVSDGYAMNYLFPHKLAEVATHQKVAALEVSRAEHEAHAHIQEELIAATLRSAQGARVELTERATEKGGLFKAVGPAEIARALKEQKGIVIPEDSVALEHPIKTTGEHPVQLAHKRAKAEILLNIAAQK